ncbi:Malate synthase A [Providencia rustigianii]|nr:Malate synthase A [Providencia rustigianii]
MEQQLSISDLTFTKDITQQDEQVLHADSIAFLSFLVEEFLPRREQLLKDRIERQKSIDAGMLPNFIMESNSIKNSEWKIQNIPDDLMDRRIEITGPVERKMVINALNANVKVFMADFEDSLSPSWEKLIEGQINLSDAIKGEISYTNENGKVYQLKSNPAVLIARVRGLHLDEKHVLVDGKPISGGAV